MELKKGTLLQHGPPNLDALARMVDQLPDGHDLHDPASRQHRAYTQLATAPDPMLREIGEQLRDGTMSPRDLLRVPEYTNAIFENLSADRVDKLTELLNTLQEHVDELAAEKRRAGRAG